LAEQTPRSLELTTELLNEAELSIIRFVQWQWYPEEMKALHAAIAFTCNRSHPLQKLDPVLIDETMRVGGRLERALIDDQAKHPVILPKCAVVSRMILEDIHRSVGHLGRNTILTASREKYWIIGATSLIKQIMSKCVTCHKHQGKLFTQKMADLPEERLVHGQPPSTNVGMDYFGPFEIKQGRKVFKRYGVIFTCMSVRAVHLEIAHSLDTDSCINAIRRFVCRRGEVQRIRSDNGTNLFGSEKEMREALQQCNVEKVQQHLVNKGITWDFNPPSASHFGGVWERLRIINFVL
jgi:hypothetical protein